MKRLVEDFFDDIDIEDSVDDTNEIVIDSKGLDIYDYMYYQYFICIEYNFNGSISRESKLEFVKEFVSHILKMTDALCMSKVPVNVFTYTWSYSSNKTDIEQITNVTEDVNNAVFHGGYFGTYEQYVSFMIALNPSIKSSKVLDILINYLFRVRNKDRRISSYTETRINFRPNTGDRSKPFTYIGDVQINNKDYHSKPLDTLNRVVQKLCPNTLSSVYKRYKFSDDGDRFEQIKRYEEFDGITDPNKQLPDDVEIFIKGSGMGGRVRLGSLSKPVEKYKPILESIIKLLSKKPHKGRAYSVIERKEEVDFKYIIASKFIYDNKEFQIILEVPFNESQKLKEYFGHV